MKFVFETHLSLFLLSEFQCESYYTFYDSLGEPTGVRCVNMPYFECFYYIIVTVATVGYGDFSPTYTYSRVVVMFIIFFSLVVIPMQINKLTTLLAMESVFRNPYRPTQDAGHVILCGAVNERAKLDRFMKVCLLVLN